MDSQMSGCILLLLLSSYSTSFIAEDSCGGSFFFVHEVPLKNSPIFAFPHLVVPFIWCHLSWTHAGDSVLRSVQSSFQGGK